MLYAYTPYLIPSFLAAMASWGTVIFAWRHRAEKGIKALLGLSFAASLWGICYSLEIAGSDLATKVFWAKCQYLAIPFIPPFFLLFTFHFVNRERWLTPSVLRMLFIFPTLLPFLAFTTERHGLIWRTYHLESGPFLALWVDHGALFWVLWIYSQIVLLISTVVMLYEVAHFPTLFRGQARFLLIAVLAPWVTNAIYVVGSNPVPGYDWTPFAFAISVSAFAWGSLRHQFLALMPIAHQIVFENMQEGALVLDMQERIVEVNRAARILTGLTNRAIGQKPEMVLAQRWPLTRHLMEVKEKKVAFAFGDHPPRYFELQISRILDIQQNPQGWLVLLRDVTEDKMTENRLREAEAKYRVFVENSPFVTYMARLDTLGALSFISTQVEALLGYSTETMLATPTLWVNLLHPDDRLRVLQENARHNQTGEKMQSEYRLLARNGDVVWVFNKAIRIQLSPTEPFYSLGVWQDITEQKLASQKLLEKAEELKRSNVDLQQFAYAVSHDLQEPLRTVNTYIQLYQRRYAHTLDDESGEFMQFIVDGAHRMKSMIDDLLEYSRVSTRGKPPVMTDCNRVLQEQLTYLLPKQSDPDVIITYDELPCLMVDEVQIGQLLRNLIGNALKYRAEPPPRVHVAAKWITIPINAQRKVTASWVGKGTGAWLFTVADNGIGIAPEFHERIFQIFQRLHTRDEYPGTGIGLALCKRIVERHGGEIWVDSQLGQGATFYFTLPASIHQDYVN